MSLVFNTGLGLFFCFWLHLTLFGETSGHETGPDAVTVSVNEGEDAVLPCSISTRQSIVREMFDWKKDQTDGQTDGQKEVFLYNAGVIYQNGRAGQDPQFKDRVSHFSEQLDVGNASIIITDTKVEDGGNYTCLFPRTKPRETFYISLVVGRVFKDRSAENPGAPSSPFTKIEDVTEAGVLLQCRAQFAFPKPTLQWKDDGGNLLPAEEPQVTERRGRYEVVLRTTVTQPPSNRFYCEVRQDQIGHVVSESITVPERLFESCHPAGISVFIGVFLAGALLVAVPLALLMCANIISCSKGSRLQKKEEGPAEKMMPDTGCVTLVL